MRFVAWLALIFSASVFGEPSNFEAFDFKNCLHWGITNEMYGDLNAAPRGYVAAVELANRQPYSRHKSMSNAEFERMYEDHLYEVVVVYSALARNRESKQYKSIEKYGVCKLHYPRGIECLPNQDFPLSGASYQVVRSKGALPTLRCVGGCSEAPVAIHDMGYETMDGERNIEQESALRRFKKMCGRTP
jgi:hypothetical protein